ncbi:MAG: retroviral-like aspartic protease family protein [Treponema sp.]|jgi:clan AA aspartic protease|nr:retroviral-like aspartic protease family protein [Treponema sp.]
MGNVHAEITVKNGGDLIRVQDGIIPEQDIRSVTVTALVDTGATSLIINEDMRQKLGLSVIGTRTANLAGGSKVECKVTEPVEIHWRDRKVSINAFVLPEGRVLLGVIPLEFMDLVVDPKRQELIPAHGEEILTLIM